MLGFVIIVGAVGVAVVDITNNAAGGRYAVDAPLDTNAFVAPNRVAAMQRTSSLRKDIME